MANPRFPIYIPSKGRATPGHTMRILDQIGVPFRVVVEEAEHATYAARWGAERLLVLDPAYQRDYETCDDLGPEVSPGVGAVRNFILDHARAEGHAWHWMADDNISMFERLHHNRRTPVGDGTIFYAMETFCLRYLNVAMAGPNYHMFAPSRAEHAPFKTGTRIYSCQLVRSDVPFRWRGRWNDDTITCLDLLKAGWQTVLFNAFLQHKLRTQLVAGGMTDLYREHGTLVKSQMLTRTHPDVTRVVWRFRRWHHEVDYSRWRNRPLVRRPDVELPDEPGHRFELVPRELHHRGARGN
jgi:hypothetical protein